MDNLKKKMDDNKFKCILFYTFFFLIILICNLATRIGTDETWSYGFSHNIYKGLLPYVDFNMVITPLYPLLMSLPFHILGSSIVVYEIEHSIIMLMIIHLIRKIIDSDWAYVLSALVFIPLFFIANYNTFLFFLFCLIVYLERKEASDYLIGFILGLIFLTKQSIGIMMFLPSLYYIFKRKKFGKRVLGFIVPNIIFFIYLVWTNSLFAFLDLCFFGLFDFASKNAGFSRFSFLLVILIFFVSLIFILKNKSNLTGYYALVFFIGMVVPIFDYWHLYYGFCAVLLFIISLLKNRYINEKLFFYCIIGFYIIVNFNNIKEIGLDNKLAHFGYKNLGLSVEQLDEVKIVNEFIQTHKKNVVILSKDAYFLKICNNIKIESTDLINTGNFGYNGTNKLIKVLKNKKNFYFLVDRKIIGHLDRKAINYVVKNSKKIDEITIFDVYYK